MSIVEMMVGDLKWQPPVEAMARAMYEGESLQRIEDGKMSGQVAWDDTSEGVRAWWVDRANEAAGVLTDAR